MPLALQLVSPNRYCGFRSAQTLADRAVWFGVNRVAGWGPLIAASVAACLYLADPDFASGRSLLGILALAVPVFAALAAAGVHDRNIARQST